MKKYDTVVFIGRFQPLHNGHIEVMKQGLLHATKNFIVLVGSVNGPRTFKNPFTFAQRKEVIDSVLHNQLRDFCTDVNVVVEGVSDSKYNNDSWMEDVQKIISSVNSKGGSVAIVGYKKDDSSSYLTWFPQWGEIKVSYDEDAAVVDATTVRNILFEGLNPGFFRGVLPSASYEFLEAFKATAEYARIKDEYEIVKAYKKSWEAAPYAPTFVCADAVVLCAGHILMIERGAHPGKGQMALPGGFLNQNETVLDCAVRELIEETGIDIPEKALRGSIDFDKGGVVFDDPNRSLRGRTITHAFRFNVKLDNKGRLPKVKGSDDAAAAVWIPLSELDEDNIYEDHLAIIDKMR
jgi:bifunctional NMN adenylyltransferase/nudix hydrolase